MTPFIEALAASCAAGVYAIVLLLVPLAPLIQLILGFGIGAWSARHLTQWVGDRSGTAADWLARLGGFLPPLYSLAVALGGWGCTLVLGRLIPHWDRGVALPLLVGWWGGSLVPWLGGWVFRRCPWPALRSLTGEKDQRW